MVTLKLDGKVMGPWVAECQRAWHAVRAETGSRRIRLDLREVTFMDRPGTEMLRQIYRANPAEILADSPLTKYFAERIKQAEAEQNGGN